MNGYFGALMRSSGLSIGAPAPALGHVEAGGIEVEVERSPTAMAPASVPAASTPSPASAPVSVAQPLPALAAPATPVHERAAPELPLVQARLATPPQADPGAAADASVDPSLSPATPLAAEPTTPPMTQALVRAAMQWVAADPLQTRSVAQVEPPPAPSVVAVTAQARTVTPTRQPLREAALEHDEQEPAAALAHPVTPAETGKREPMPVPSLAIRPTRSVPMTPPEPLTPPAHDEVVEVSIGAIHVRVDAPAAQTIARPAPAPPAAPRAAALAPRSTLSRRALRRI